MPLVWSLNLLSADQSESAEETWQMATKGANIQEFVDQVAKITGKTFIVDPKLEGKSQLSRAHRWVRRAYTSYF